MTSTSGSDARAAQQAVVGQAQQHELFARFRRSSISVPPERRKVAGATT